MGAIDVVVDRFARKCWWADKDDLYQEAALVEIQVTAKGYPSDSYLQKCVAKRLSSVLWEMSSPVSAPKDRRREKLSGLHRAAMPETLYSSEFDVEDHVLLKRALERVENRMPHLFDVASQVLMGERPRDIEGASGVSRRFIYDAVARVRKALKEDLGGELCQSE